MCKFGYTGGECVLLGLFCVRTRKSCLPSQSGAAVYRPADLGEGARGLPRHGRVQAGEHRGAGGRGVGEWGWGRKTDVVDDVFI